MYLSDRDLEYAHYLGDLILDPRPQEFGPSSIDLHLDTAKEARVWDIRRYEASLQGQGVQRPSVALGKLDYKQFADQYAIPVPAYDVSRDDALVYHIGDSVILCPGGFFLWQTKEVVGTPTTKARY